MLERYRREFVSFKAAIWRERYRVERTRKEASSIQAATAHVFERYGELYSREAIGQIEREIQQTPAHFETQIAGLHRLLGFAEQCYLSNSVQELTTEIDESLCAGFIELLGRRLAFRDASPSAAADPDPVRRQAIHSRRLSIISRSNDLRLERWKKLTAAAESLGDCCRRGLLARLRGSDHASEDATRGAEILLQRTEEAYVSCLNEALRREVGVTAQDAEPADYLRLQYLARYDAHYPPGFTPPRLFPVYRETMAGIGIAVDAQANIELECVPRTLENESTCFPISVPDEIKILMRPSGGMSDYGSLLGLSGQAQHCAWTAADIRPEFKYAGDAALPATYGVLFAALISERAWLSGILGLSDSRDFIRSGALATVGQLRSHAARTLYEHKMESTDGGLAGCASAPRDYSELLTRATGVTVPEAEYLFDIDEVCGPADRLRSEAFAAQLREYLKSRFGECWWASRRAGSFLQEIWETGNRYTAAEMASQIGIGVIVYDQLIDELNTTLRRG